MSFKRQPALNWHQEVPGARWFRADLHVHTIDDHPGGRAKVPAGLNGANLCDPQFLKDYARTFLRAAIAANVQVIALTPHAVRLGASADTSAVWAIVDCWNQENDDDGVPFREKIYSVFPGFEPNLSDGSEGVHLLFIFDPEIGRERYLSLFDAVMNGRTPYLDGKSLRISERRVVDALDTVEKRRRDGEKSNAQWDYIVLAPHAEAHHGVIHEARKQVLEQFPCERLSAYETKKNALPSDYTEDSKPGSFLLPFMRRNRQAFFVGSDAYGLAQPGYGPSDFELGHRVTWLKLAQPRIEALRQAFLAADSRVACAYEKDPSGQLIERAFSPESFPLQRPWLRKVTIKGGDSFFGGLSDGREIQTEIPFNPGLTCIIGASMSGKSTLLDGLRLFANRPLPKDPSLRDTVEKRGRFLSKAGTTVTLETPLPSDEAPGERWPADFFTQGELHSLTQSDRIIEILRGLAGADRIKLEDAEDSIRQQDLRLQQIATSIAKALEERDEASQRKLEADRASEALAEFEKAGLSELRRITRLKKLLEGSKESADNALKEAAQTRSTVGNGILNAEIIRELPVVHDEQGALVDITALHAQAQAALTQVEASLQTWQKGLNLVYKKTAQQNDEQREKMDLALRQAGLNAEELSNIQSLSRKAEFKDAYHQALEEKSAALSLAQNAFFDLIKERENNVEQLREYYDALTRRVAERFEDKIRVRRIEHAENQALNEFIRNLRISGITQWWNSTADSSPSPRRLADALDHDQLDSLNASATVGTRLKESIGEAKRYALRALRSDDRYVLEQKLETGEYRRVEELSGGRRVSLLLSLLLEMDDDRPLVIDQPEDELDNRFLWETVLPTLRRIKSHRQVILVTHNANIVVNADADLVVQLDATANRGSVARYGAIEDPDVRKAIVETVDGGRDAFELRKTKYGF